MDVGFGSLTKPNTPRPQRRDVQTERFNSIEIWKKNRWKRTRRTHACAGFYVSCVYIYHHKSAGRDTQHEAIVTI